MNLSYTESILLLSLTLILCLWIAGWVIYLIYKPYHNRKAMRFWVKASNEKNPELTNVESMKKLLKKYKIW